MDFKLRACGFSVQFSPYVADKLAVCCSQNFGLVGRGFVSIFQFASDRLTELVSYETKDCLFDCCWSETNENLLVTAAADGLLRIFDTMTPSNDDPIFTLAEHTKEVASVKWNQQRQDVFLSASWDGLIKMWRLGQPMSIQTFTGHQHSVYCVSWNVITPNTFSSVSGDRTIKIWDDRGPMAVSSWVAHENEVLCVDWCKYNDQLLVSGSVDKTLKIWDIRQTTQPIQHLTGHRYAVKRCLFSPHSVDMVLSCSYDMTVRLWDLSQASDAILRSRIWDHHNEFVGGIDFSNHIENQVVSVGWDERIHLWNLSNSL